MASLGFGTVAPAVASPARSHMLGRSVARPSSAQVVPAATKSVAAAKAAEQEKGLFDLIFGPMFKEDQLLETDPILNKVEGKAAAAARATGKAAAAAAAKKANDGGFSLGGLFSKKG